MKAFLNQVPFYSSLASFSQQFSRVVAWCKTVIEQIGVLGQLVVTSTAVVFLVKGKESVPAYVIPLEQVTEIQLGSHSAIQSIWPHSPLHCGLLPFSSLTRPLIGSMPEDTRLSSPRFEPAVTLHHANVLVVTCSNCDLHLFFGFWTIATLDSAARHLRYAAQKKQEKSKEASPPAPRSVMSGSFSHHRPYTAEIFGRERSSSAGEVQLPPSSLLSQSERPPRRGSHLAREKHSLARSSAGETSRKETSPRSPRSPRSPISPRNHPFTLPHSASMAAPSSLRKSMSSRIMDPQTAFGGFSRSPPSASLSFAYPPTPGSPTAVPLPSSSSSSSTLHGSALTDVVHVTLSRMRISAAEVPTSSPADIMMGECESDAQ